MSRSTLCWPRRGLTHCRVAVYTSAASRPTLSRVATYIATSEAAPLVSPSLWSILLPFDPPTREVKDDQLPRVHCHPAGQLQRRAGGGAHQGADRDGVGPGRRMQ